MDRFHTGSLSRVEDPLLVQIALGRRAAADQIRLVRVANVS